MDRSSSEPQSLSPSPLLLSQSVRQPVRFHCGYNNYEPLGSRYSVCPIPDDGPRAFQRKSALCYYWYHCYHCYHGEGQKDNLQTHVFMVTVSSLIKTWSLDPWQGPSVRIRGISSAKAKDLMRKSIPALLLGRPEERACNLATIIPNPKR